MENLNPAVKPDDQMAEGQVSEDVKLQEQSSPEITPEEVVPEATPQAGDKTDPNLLLKALKEEREKRKKLEEELEILQSSTPSEEEVYTDEGKALEKKISALAEKVNSTKEERELEKVYSQYPILKEKAEEFNEFRQADYPKAKLESVAKLYLAENGLLEPARKGLEKPTGGPRIPLTSGMTADDVKTLRETNFKKYQDMLLKGQIKVE
uniref:Uncharacterized protein n=1 Tax=viral metagenome TaxID=1070528 RepID=A0A6H1ZYP9_9ZZZZ